MLVVCRQESSFHLVVNVSFPLYVRGRRGRDRTVAGFTITYAISTYHN